MLGTAAAVASETTYYGRNGGEGEEGELQAKKFEIALCREYANLPLRIGREMIPSHRGIQKRRGSFQVARLPSIQYHVAHPESFTQHRSDSGFTVARLRSTT